MILVHLYATSTSNTFSFPETSERLSRGIYFFLRFIGTGFIFKRPISFPGVGVRGRSGFRSTVYKRRWDLSRRDMKLLADEGVDKPIIDKLRESGFDVHYILETNQVHKMKSF